MECPIGLIQPVSRTLPLLIYQLTSSLDLPTRIHAQVYRGETPLPNGAEYVSGESLSGSKNLCVMCVHCCIEPPI